MRRTVWTTVTLLLLLAATTVAAAQEAKLDGLTGFKTKAELDDLAAKFHSGDLKSAQFLFARSRGPYQVGIKHVVPGQHFGEMHKTVDEFFLIVSGTGNVTVGGELTEAKARPLDPNEVRGVSIVGGKTVKVAQGDVISVPRGTPHRMDLAEGELVCVAIMMFGAPPAPAAQLSLGDLPEGVRNRVLAEKGAKIESMKKTSAGYGIELVTAGGKEKSFNIDPNGKVLAMETEVDMASLSPAVQAGIKAAVQKAGARLVKIDAVDLLDSLHYYDADVVLPDGKKTELRVGLDGGPVKLPNANNGQ